MKILILGDFSGRGSAPDLQQKPPLQQRPVHRIDLDRFDDVMVRLSPRVRLDGGIAGTSAKVLEIRELDDFRPERLGQKIGSVCNLLESRKRLLSPATFAQAVDELTRGILATAPVGDRPAKAVPQATTKSSENDSAMLERLLGPRPAGAASQSETRSGAISPSLDQLIHKAIEPHIVPKFDPNRDVYVAAVDNAVGVLLRSVLHAPSFQSLEASWRSLRRLVESVEDDGAIQVFILDVTREELLADVPTEDSQLREWNFFRRLSDHSGQGGDAPWSLMIGDFRLGAETGELALLGALAAVAEQLQIPLISGADSGLLGCRSLVECPDPADWRALDADTARYWHALRRSSAAKWVGLVLPRVLLRLPYGKGTDEVDSFAFEEFGTGRHHEGYLWGNSSYLCAELIVRDFAEEGWSLQLGSQYDVVDLPAHSYSEAGEVKLQPCAEAAFGERTADAILQRGLMPLIGRKDRNAVRLPRFQSIAEPLSPLAGPWS